MKVRHYTSDMLWKTDPRKVAQFINNIREFFVLKGFTEVFTPALVKSGAFESCLDTLQVKGGLGELQTSPEISMKKLISEYPISVFQIAHSFRDDPLTEIHFKEFLMLEFYEMGASYLETMELMKLFLNELSGRSLEFSTFSVDEAFWNYAGIDLKSCGTEEKLREKILSLGSPVLSPTDDWEEMYFKVLIEKVEPSFSKQDPVILMDYPTSQCALSRISPLGFAERFEIYWHGMEICNGCSELTEIGELKERYNMESLKREKRGLAPHPLPQDLLDAFEKGLPPMSGVAVGMERLSMALAKV